MLVFLNSMKREIIMSAYIPGNPVRPASYLMAENRKYSTLIEQQFCILITFCLVTSKIQKLKKMYSMYVTYCSVSTAFFKILLPPINI
jgi:hypothetical protein